MSSSEHLLSWVMDSWLQFLGERKTQSTEWADSVLFPLSVLEFLALRMVSEDQQCVGWLEVFYNGTWGSVCRSPMEDITVSMICSQFGCGNKGTLNTFVDLREGSRLWWVDGIRCRKTETSLWQCPSDPWKYTSCSPYQEAYISCAGDLLSASIPTLKDIIRVILYSPI